MIDKKWDLCVIGAGPAGMASSLAAASCGLEVLLLDEHDTLGGHIYKGLEGPFASRFMESTTFAQGQKIIGQFHQSGVCFLPRHTIWHAEPGKIIASHNGQSRTIRTSSLIVANGAMERILPFPGWTLPGVMALGGADLAWRADGLIPQSPLALMGNGPLLLLMANHLINNGIIPEAIIDTGLITSRLWSIPQMPGALLDLPYLTKGLTLVLNVLRRKIPIIRATRVRVEGEHSIRNVICTTGNTEKRLKVVSLLVHDGFIPRTHFSRLMRCRHAWHRTQRYWYPICDPFGKALGMSGLYFAGDSVKVHGSDAALYKGQLAGISVARDLGAITTQEAVLRSRKYRYQLYQLMIARAYVLNFFRPNPDVYRLDDDTIICRCEGITAGQVREAVTEGCLDVSEIKTRTRAGMGRCQGRMCGLAIAEIAAAALNSNPKNIGSLNIRSPIRPIAMREFCEFEERGTR